MSYTLPSANRPYAMLKKIDKAFDHLLEAQELIHSMHWTHVPTARALGNLVAHRITIAMKQLMGIASTDDRSKLTSLASAVTHAAMSAPQAAKIKPHRRGAECFDADTYISGLILQALETQPR
ncbi:hypothetical protein [Novosphingobium bradum]